MSSPENTVQDMLESAGSLYTQEDVDRIHAQEEAGFLVMVAAKKRGDTSFVSRGSGRLGYTIIMVGQNRQWVRGMLCDSPGHSDRADAFVRRFNATRVDR